MGKRKRKRVMVGDEAISQPQLLDIGKTYRMKFDYTVERRGLHSVFHGSSTSCVNNNKSLSFQAFGDTAKARGYLDQLESLDCPFIPKPQLYNEYDMRGVIINETIYDSLETWLKRKNLHIWSYNSDKTKCLGFGDDACIVSSRILKALMHIHNRNKCHGDLLNGITISCENDVKLVGHTPQENIHERILKDLEDFKKFIEMVILAHPIEANLDMLVAVALFYETFKHFPKDDTKIQMWELKWAKLKYFEAFFKLNGPLTDMTNWFNGIPAHSALHKVLHYNQMFSKEYQFNNGVLPFMRDAYFHSKEEMITPEVHVIERVLYDTVPEACPKIFFEVVMIYVSVAVKKFGDIVSFLKEGPLVFHLQE